MPSSKAGKSNAKRPQDRQQPSTGFGSSWKKPLSDLTLPSGERCQVKRPGVQGLIKASVLHSLDSLTAIVQNETIPKAEGKPTTDVQAVVNDPKKFGQMMTQVDKIVCFVVTQPKVLPDMVPVLEPKSTTAGHEDRPVKIDPETGEPMMRPIEDDERDPEAVYVDYIDEVDKMFIMNFAVGGSGDLAEFRAATEASLGGLSAGEAAASEAE